MVKLFSVSLISLFFGLFAPALAAPAPSCMNSYYLTKDPACVDAVLASLMQMSAAQIMGGPIPGFLAVIFTNAPDERERILKAEASDGVKDAEMLALFLADMPDAARRFGDGGGGRKDVFDKLQAIGVAPLVSIRPSFAAGDNDLLIGAYMASGDTSWILHILDNFSSADDLMAADGIRAGLLNSKFGPLLAPPGREKIAIQALCDKYVCRDNPAKLRRVLTLGSAFWALQTLGSQDNRVGRTFAAFFGQDQRLNAIAKSEQGAFSNYMTTLAIVAGAKTSPAQERFVSAANESLAIYEKFGSATAALAPLDALRKQNAAPAAK
jgi:hypothetical protein